MLPMSSNRNVKPAIPPAETAKELRVSCRAPKEMVEDVERVAKAIGVSESDIVRMAIKRYLPEIEKQAKAA